MTTFYTGFGTSTSCLLTYLKIKKIEGGKLSQPTHPPPTHHNTRPPGAIGVGLSLDPEGRLRLWAAFKPLQFKKSVRIKKFLSNLFGTLGI